MYTVPENTCRGHECTMQRALPIVGPIAAFTAMLIPMLYYVVPAMMG